MPISTALASNQEALSLRVRYRAEANGQIVHDSLHTRPGWTKTYLLQCEGRATGFGSVAIGGPWKDKRTVLEFYVLPEYRTRAFELFEAFLATADCKSMEVQSNDTLVTVMLHTFAREICTEKIVMRTLRRCPRAAPCCVASRPRQRRGRSWRSEAERPITCLRWTASPRDRGASCIITTSPMWTYRWK